MSSDMYIKSFVLTDGVKEVRYDGYEMTEQTAHRIKALMDAWLNQRRD